LIAISAPQLISIWETGINQHPLERPITMLTLTSSAPGETLEKLSIGQRNAELIQLRKTIFGQSLVCVVACPFCQESLEFTLNLNELEQSHSTAATQSIKINEFEIIFRSITTADLLAIRNCHEIAQATRQLLQQCVLNCCQSQQVIPLKQLPDSVVDALAKEMSACDPQAELLLNLACTVCEEKWQAPLDIATIIWEEIQQKALQLLNEVHQLASAYGWLEQDILALTPQRRQFYLNKYYE